MAKEYATLGGGCFWCIEAAFEMLKGVKEAVSGYAGGHTTDPTYKTICSGQTGHAEVIRIEFDNEVISFSTLLDFFFEAHDPTTLNRQGNDVGPQYRSIILFETEEQQEIAQEKITELKKSRAIVTELKQLEKFYTAEEYHQQFFESNPSHGYCTVVVQPKIDSLSKKFASLLK